MVFDVVANDVDRRFDPVFLQDREGLGVDLFVAVVEGDHDRARRQIFAAGDSVQQILRRDKGAADIDQRLHLPFKLRQRDPRRDRISFRVRIDKGAIVEDRQMRAAIVEIARQLDRVLALAQLAVDQIRVEFSRRFVEISVRQHKGKDDRADQEPDDKISQRF